MRVAVDIDGTIDSDPAAFLSLCSALMRAGHQVFILTGCSSPKVTKADKHAKKTYLRSMGFRKNAAYVKLRLFASPPHRGKARWCRKHKVAILIDNSVKTAQLADGDTTVLVPWATRDPKAET